MGVQGSKWTAQHRAKFIRSMKLRRKEREQLNDTKTEQPEASHRGDASLNDEVAVAYAFGKTQAWLEHFTQSSNLPTASFTRRVAELLFRATRGSVLGSFDSMPSMRRNASVRRKG